MVLRLVLKSMFKKKTKKVFLFRKQTYMVWMQEKSHPALRVLEFHLDLNLLLSVLPLVVPFSSFLLLYPEIRN